MDLPLDDVAAVFADAVNTQKTREPPPEKASENAGPRALAATGLSVARAGPPGQPLHEWPFWSMSHLCPDHRRQVPLGLMLRRLEHSEKLGPGFKPHLTELKKKIRAELGQQGSLEAMGRYKWDAEAPRAAPGLCRCQHKDGALRPLQRRIEAMVGDEDCSGEATAVCAVCGICGFLIRFPLVFIDVDLLVGMIPTFLEGMGSDVAAVIHRHGVVLCVFNREQEIHVRALLDERKAKYLVFNVCSQFFVPFRKSEQTGGGAIAAHRFFEMKFIQLRKFDMRSKIEFGEDEVLEEWEGLKDVELVKVGGNREEGMLVEVVPKAVNEVNMTHAIGPNKFVDCYKTPVQNQFFAGGLDLPYCTYRRRIGWIHPATHTKEGIEYLRANPEVARKELHPSADQWIVGMGRNLPD